MRVYKWRLQAEREAREAGKPTLTDDEVADFVARFIPAYVTYLPGRGGCEQFSTHVAVTHD